MGQFQTIGYLSRLSANHFVAGDSSRADGGAALRPGYFWLYPPFALYVVAPLAWLSDAWAYALLAGIEVMALGISLWLLQRLEPFRRMRREWLLAIALSARAGRDHHRPEQCAHHAVRRRRRDSLDPWTGGPSLRPARAARDQADEDVVGLRHRAGRMERHGVVAAGYLLCVSDAPGPSASTNLGLGEYSIFPNCSGEPYLGLSLGNVGRKRPDADHLGVHRSGIDAWRRSSPGERPVRPCGTWESACCWRSPRNPYAQFYDALVFAVPATVWWAERDRWRDEPWLVVAALLAVAWCNEQWLYSWGALSTAAGLLWLPKVSLVGPVAAVWLVLAARQAIWSSSSPWRTYDAKAQRQPLA